MQQQQAHGQQGGPSAQQQQQQQQQQQAQLAVNQAVQQAMQQRQGGGPAQSITDLAVNYMSAITAAQKSGGGGPGLGMLPSLGGGQGAQGGAPGSGPGGLSWDPRLSYPMMSHMNTLNAMSSMPNLLSLQQQYGQHPTLSGRGYNLDANMILGAAGHNILQAGLDHRKSRHIKSPSQLKTLKLFFQTNQRPSKEDIRKLVKDTNLPHQEVTRWFRNERHKEKKQQEAKQEAIQGHLKGNGPNMGGPPHMQPPPGHPGHMGHPGHPGHPGHMLQQQQQQQQQHKPHKRKRGDGDDGSETGSEGPEEGLHAGVFGPAPQQRMAAIHTFLSSLADPGEVEAAEKVLEAKRISMGAEPLLPQLPQLGGGLQSPEHTWQLLQHSFMSKAEQEAKRRKMQQMQQQQGGKSAAEQAVNAAAAAAAASGAGGLEPSMIHGLTQVFAKHPDYLKEINKNLGIMLPQQQQ